MHKPASQTHKPYKYTLFCTTPIEVPIYNMHVRISRQSYRIQSTVDTGSTAYITAVWYQRETAYRP